MTSKNIKWLSLVILFLILLVIMYLGYKIVQKRAFSYEFSPKQDYQYRFDTGIAEILEISVEGDRISLLGLSDGCNTAFIEIGLRSTLKGFAYQPEVAMIGGEDTLYQNFECRAKGVRYLNVSQLVQKGSKEIQFVFSGCKPMSSNVKLIAYRNADPASERVLILSPHPDDAEIVAYGLYASNPQNTFIATITAGDAGSMRYDELYSDSTVHYIKKGQVRAWNSIAVPMLGGIPAENAVNLGYFDASLRKMHDDTLALAKSRYLNTSDIRLFRSANCGHLPDTLQPQSTWRSLVNDLKFLLLKVEPTIIVSSYPALDWHYDHKYTTVALFQAMNELKYQNCDILLCTNHLPLTDMYPDGKIGSQVSLPPYFDDEPIYFDRLYSFPLSETLQADKVLALDAMNDLRPDTQYRNTKASWEQFKNNFYDKLYLRESDYFRRSIRSNELFFVIDGKNMLKPNIQKKIIGEL